MRAFISYSKINRKSAALIKDALEDIGISGFLAHEDLQVSEEWRDEIIAELKKADVFVALLSAEFKESEWCAQEIGFITSRSDVLVIPLSLDETVAYGFISKLQSKRIHEPEDIPAVLRDVLLKKRPRVMIPIWIKKVKNAGGWRTAENLVEPLVPYFDKFEDGEIDAFLKAALGNSQVWDASKCRVQFLPAFARQHWKKISKGQKADLVRKLEMSAEELRSAR